MTKTTDTNATEDDDQTREGLKWVTGGIAVASTALVLAGLSGSAVARLTRIHPLEFWSGVSLLVASTVCGVTGLFLSRQPRWRTGAGLVGLALFLVGTLVLVGFHAEATGRQERPTATLNVVKTQNGYSAQAKVKAAGLKPDEYIFVLIQGQNSQRHLEPNSAAFDDSADTIPENEYSKQRLYKGRIGSSPEGTVDVPIELSFAQGLYEQLVIQALIAQPGDVDREEELESGKRNADRSFACDAESPDVSCATVLVPEAPSSS